MSRLRRLLKVAVLTSALVTLFAAGCLSGVTPAGVASRGVGGDGVVPSDDGAATSTAPSPSSTTTSSTTTSTTTTVPTTTTTGPASTLPKFEVDRALRHVKVLSTTIGVRRAGTWKETRAARYIERELKKYRLKPVVGTFRIHGGRTSRNVSVFIKGKRNSDGQLKYGKRYLILGGHMDSKYPAPGANDNASGVAVLLELARMWASSPPPITVQVVFFGAEEIVDGNPDHHHYGSRSLAKKIKKGGNLIGMMSIDDVGVGPDLHVRAMQKGPSTLWKQLLEVRRAAKIKATFKKDPGWSDHEPFEVKGYPVAWIEYRPDWAGHTKHDTFRRIRKGHLEAAARWVTTYLANLNWKKVRALDKASP